MGGPPVGLLQDATYDSGALPLTERSVVLIYTDGVVEARNRDDEEFGLARLVDTCRTADRNVDALLHTVINAVDGWRGDVEQGDDITLIAVAVGDR
jgi:sigma-B regulation protein RsbU (phosphoserine phosphatase)